MTSVQEDDADWRPGGTDSRTADGQLMAQQLDGCADGQRLVVSTESTECTMRVVRHRWCDALMSLTYLEQTVVITAVMCGGEWRRNVRNCYTLTVRIAVFEGP